jgi:hypothetical protein
MHEEIADDFEHDGENGNAMEFRGLQKGNSFCLTLNTVADPVHNKSSLVY